MTGWSVLGATDAGSTADAGWTAFSGFSLLGNDVTDKSDFDVDGEMIDADSKTTSLASLFRRAVVTFQALGLGVFRYLYDAYISKDGLLVASKDSGNSGGLWKAVLGSSSAEPTASSRGSAGSAITVPLTHNHTPAIILNHKQMSRWSVDAVRLVRHQLHRAGGGVLPPLCYGEHWGEGSSGDSVWDLDQINEKLPTWAAFDGDSGVVITDVVAMCAEIEGLVDTMDLHMQTQRARRLDKLMPEPTVRRRWWMIVLGIPTCLYASYQYVQYQRDMKEMFGRAVTKAMTFYVEHVKDPLMYMYTEFFTSKLRDKITDKEALDETRAALKRMLYQFLNDAHPNIPEATRKKMSEDMNVKLIEEEFEKSVPNAVRNVMTGEIVRMSLIQMQFLKKELLTAMDAMDQVMESNEFNFRMSSMMPAMVSVYVFRAVMRKLYYFLMPGSKKSKEETYSTVRGVLLDIERLLLMRDDPPDAPEELVVGNAYSTAATNNPPTDFKVGLSFDTITEGDEEATNTTVKKKKSDSLNRATLNENDLGMLMLLVHEIQGIVTREQRRFTRVDRANVLEDLAELAGERGVVSIKQQLSIVSRMGRTYPFLKVLSSGAVI